MSGGIWRDRKYAVVRIDAPYLPNRCVLTNQPVEEEAKLRRKLSYTPPWIYITILISLLVVIILAAILGKSIKTQIGLTPEQIERRKKRTLNFTIMLFVSIPLMAAGFINQDLFILFLPGIVMLLLSLWKLARVRSILYISKMDKQFVWLGGCCPAFLESLPEFRR